MPDVPYPKPEPPTRTEVARARVSTAADVVRVFLTGGSRAVSVRRVLLYGIVAIGIIAMLPGVAIVALLLLALTDAVVEL